MINNYQVEKISEIHLLLENIKNEYKNNIKPILLKKSPILFPNPHTVPKLKKIQINRGLGLFAQNSKLLTKSIEEFTMITGQKPIVTKAKNAIAGFKIRNNMELGLTVTLRGEKMYSFLTKLIFFTFSQIKDFRGLSIRSFDKCGNYTIGLKEQLIFPEIEYEDIDKLLGLNITIVIEHSLSKSNTTILTRILQSVILLKFLHFPFKDCGYYQKYFILSEITKTWDKKKHLKRKRWSHD